MRIGKLLGQVRGYLNSISQVTFIANKNPWYIAGKEVLFAFLYPRGQTVKAGHVGHIVHKHDRVDVPVIVLHHTLPEALLARRIP